MKLQTVVEASQKIRSTTRKKEKVVLISALLRQARGPETGLTACLIAGRLPYGRPGIGWGALQEVLGELSVRGEPLELIDVQRALRDLGSEKGRGAGERKRRMLHRLFSRANRDERRFLVGLLMGEIRQGALEGLVTEAVSQVANLPIEEVRRALMFTGDVCRVAQMAMQGGADALARIGPRLFHPVAPMLANPADDMDEALGRLGEAAWEFKIDGARIQIHKGGDRIKIFTRHLKDVTKRLPEIEARARDLPLEEAILEGEVVALRPDGRPLPFQTTMRRFGRILNVGKMQEQIPLSSYLFDLLYAEGEPLFQESYRRRVELLDEQVRTADRIPRLITGDRNKVQEFLKRSLAVGHEGLMAKNTESPYKAGQRGYQWLKLKPARTLDLVVLAAEWGHGRRRGWLSNLHLGARDADSGQFVMLGKTFKGLSDEMLTWMTDRLQQLEVDRDPYTVYVRPELVVEIAYSDLQESPKYPGGLALRFARVKRFRPEKTASEADTIRAVRSLFEASRG